MIQKKEAESKEKPKAIIKGENPEGFRSNNGADTSVPIIGQLSPAMKNLVAQALSNPNMLMAYKQVVSNKGAPGVDGMEVDSLKPYLQTNWNLIKEQLEQGTYEPKPVRKVEIPKPGGAGMRMLGIPTAIDRLITQAIHQVLSPIWENTFSENSYGFRPGRSAADGVRKAQSYQEEGLKIVVDIDLSKFFDEVNHSRLMSRIMERTPGEWQLHRLRLDNAAGERHTTGFAAFPTSVEYRPG
jgi:RNA-directed DNA polymerase